MCAWSIYASSLYIPNPSAENPLPSLPTPYFPPPTMATTGLASSAATKFDAVTPPKPSSLPQDIANQLLVNLDSEIAQIKETLDLEGLLDFQRVANYL